MRAAAEAVLPGPAAAGTVDDARRERARLHAIRILLLGTPLETVTGAAATLAVATTQTTAQQTLATLGRHGAIIGGTLSAALRLHLGMQLKTHNGDDGTRPGGTPQAPSPTG